MVVSHNHSVIPFHSRQLRQSTAFHAHNMTSQRVLLSIVPTIGPLHISLSSREHDSHGVRSFSQYCEQIQHSIDLLLALKTILFCRVHISKTPSTCPRNDISPFFLLLLSTGPIFAPKSSSISLTLGSCTYH